jgi:DNA replication protein DnaC
VSAALPRFNLARASGASSWTLQGKAMTKNQINKHVEEYVAYFLGDEFRPKFAILIDGPWGVGKTHLINNLVNRKFPSKEDYAYVSLYGVGNEEQFNISLIHAFYPQLNSSAAKLSGRLVNAALSFFRIKHDINISEIMRTPPVKLWIFDDFERCDMPQKQLMGCINNLIEHSESKIIVVANTSEIKEKESFRTTSEKIFGKTLRVDPNFHDAYNNFVRTTKDADFKKFLDDHSSDMHWIFDRSELNNLRIIQQVIWEFERVWNVLPIQIRDRLDLITALLRLLGIIATELRCGRIIPADLVARSKSIMFDLLRDDHKEKSRLSVASERYKPIDLTDNLLSDDVIHDILVRGVVHADSICRDLKGSRFYSREREPAIQTLWYGMDRTRVEFTKSKNEVKKRIASNELTEVGELLHFFGIWLWLSDIGVVRLSRAGVVKFGKSYMTRLMRLGRLPLLPANDWEERFLEGYGGMEFRERGSAEWRELFDYLGHCRSVVTDRWLSQQSSMVLDCLVTDFDRFVYLISGGPGEGDNFVKRCVLKYIDTTKFARALLSLKPDDFRRAMRQIEVRYDGLIERELAAEKDWLLALRSHLLKRAKGMPLMRRYAIEKLVEWHLGAKLGLPAY